MEGFQGRLISLLFGFANRPDSLTCFACGAMLSIGQHIFIELFNLAFPVWFQVAI